MHIHTSHICCAAFCSPHQNIHYYSFRFVAQDKVHLLHRVSSSRFQIRCWYDILICPVLSCVLNTYTPPAKLVFQIWNDARKEMQNKCERMFYMLFTTSLPVNLQRNARPDQGTIIASSCHIAYRVQGRHAKLKREKGVLFVHK